MQSGKDIGTWEVCESRNSRGHSDDEDDDDDDDTIELEKMRSDLTLLHQAALKEDAKEVEELLKNQPTMVNAKVAGLTPIMLAVNGRNPGIVQLLAGAVDADINILSTGFKQATALMLAASATGCAEESQRAAIISAILFQPQCDVTLKNSDGLTALALAAKFGHQEAVECLLANERVNRYPLDDIWRSVQLALASGHGEVAQCIYNEIEGAREAEIQNRLERSQQQEEPGEEERLRQLLKECKETAKSLKRTVKRLRLGKPTVGSVVTVRSNESLAKTKQSEHNLKMLPELSGCSGIIEFMTAAGVAEVTLFNGPSTAPKVALCHPDILKVVSRDGYHCVDADGQPLARHDIVRITTDVDLINKVCGIVTDKYRSSLGKFADVVFFDVDGDVYVSVGENAMVFNPLALKKIFTVTCGDNSSVKIGDEVTIIHSKSKFRELQTDEFGSWADEMSELIGTPLTVCKFHTSTESDPKCILEVKGTSSRKFRVNPQAVGLNPGHASEELRTPEIPVGTASPGSSRSSVPDLLPLSGFAPKHGELQKIKWGDIKLEKVLGSGNFGQVFLAQWGATKCAVKKIAARGLVQGYEEQRILDEATLHNRLTHPCVVQFLGIALAQTDILLVMKFIDGFDLEQILFGGKMELNNEERRALCLQIADVMRYFHDDAGVVHQDIKPSNVLVDLLTKQAHITDFGISRMSGYSSGDLIEHSMKHFTSHMSGSFYYMAPELLVPSPTDKTKFPQHNRASDVYALAMTLVEILIDTHILDAPDIITVMKVKSHSVIPGTLEQVPPAYRDILKQCLEPDPTQRPRAKTVAESFAQRQDD
ncbi:uncharacterized protein LOC129593004 [Paramacrobiotus metropolitanus]|uniref:uncharacterized protein LOC129593004 n=1 Tax=Paramacrobiotus metropolitanus TaxID=2943436 RepID=UPI002445A1B4|nr:uncharacterized protein LOC129593004 [Paramacrobiotus metropolitanus]